MKTALLTALIKLGIEKGMMQKVKPKFLSLKILAFILLFIGLLFLLMTLHQALTFYYGRLVANGSFGGAFIVLAILLLIVIHNKQKKMSEQPMSDPLTDLQNMAQPLLNSAQQAKDKVQEKISQHQGKIIVATLLAGALFGRLRARKSQNED